MRTIRYSRSFYEEFALLLEQGVERFGPQVVAQKRTKVLNTIQTFLARHPKREPDPVIGICAYQIRQTPFVVLYDFDDAELRV